MNPVTRQPLQSFEMQGYYSSSYYSRGSIHVLGIPRKLNPPAGELRESGANVTLMVKSDMLAYHNPEECAHLAFPDRCAPLFK